MTKETILRLLKVDSVKECNGNVLETLEEMRYRYVLERKVIAFASHLPGYNDGYNDDEMVEAISTSVLERIMELHDEYIAKFGELETA